MYEHRSGITCTDHHDMHSLYQLAGTVGKAPRSVAEVRQRADQRRLARYADREAAREALALLDARWSELVTTLRDLSTMDVCRLAATMATGYVTRAGVADARTFYEELITLADDEPHARELAIQALVWQSVAGASGSERQRELSRSLAWRTDHATA